MKQQALPLELIAPDLSGSQELFSRLYSGELFACNLPTPLERLRRILSGRFTQALGALDAIDTLHERFTNEALLGIFSTLRQTLTEEDVRSELLQLVSSLGLDQADFALDDLRLRVVTPRMGDISQAARAFFPHRDTWYGSPAAQINCWFPLFQDLSPAESFGFYPTHFESFVPNDSDQFDYEQFRNTVGWQGARGTGQAQTTYPRALCDLESNQCHRFALSRDQLLLFSGAHLHQTLPVLAGRTRVSFDTRIVCIADHQRGAGAPRSDNASRGSAMVDFFHIPEGHKG